MALVRRDVGEEIQADREVEVAGIEIDQVICAAGRNVVQQIVGQMGDAEEGGFATPSFSLADINQVAVHGAQASRHSSRSWWNLA